jgi:hypothetical protein
MLATYVSVSCCGVTAGDNSLGQPRDVSALKTCDRKFVFARSAKGVGAGNCSGAIGWRLNGEKRLLRAREDAADLATGLPCVRRPRVLDRKNCCICGLLAKGVEGRKCWCRCLPDALGVSLECARKRWTAVLQYLLGHQLRHMLYAQLGAFHCARRNTCGHFTDVPVDAVKRPGSWTRHSLRPSG